MLRIRFNKVIIIAIIVIIATILTFLLFHVKILKVSGDSMLPTLHTGEYIITTNLLPENPGDIVTVNFRAYGKEIFVKRLIGVGNQSISIKKKNVFIDGQQKNFLPTNNWFQSTTLYGGHTFSIPKGESFVMGDNRNSSIDSRKLGFATITGKVIAVLPHKIW